MDNWSQDLAGGGFGKGALTAGTHSLPTGTRLGKFTIQSIVGADDCSIAYTAVADGAARPCRVREFYPSAIVLRDGTTVRAAASHAPTFSWGLDRFLAQGRSLARVRHPALPAVQDVFEAHGTGYVATMLAGGRDIANWREQLVRAPSQAVYDTLIAQLGGALSALHAKGMLHLNLSPNAILIGEQGTPFIVNAGAAAAELRRRLGWPLPPSSRPFTAPEVLAGDEALIGQASDIYGLAAVLYAVVTGVTPPEASTRATQDPLVAAAAAAPATELRADFLDTIDAGLRYRADERPASVQAWLDQMLKRPQRAVRSEVLTLATTEPSSERFNTPEVVAPQHVSDGAPDVSRGGDGPTRPWRFCLASAMAGGIAGALGGVILASLLWPSCTTDACAARPLPYTVLAGIAAGLAAGFWKVRGRALARDDGRQQALRT